ncbi:MAG: glycosyltransferase family 4 protein [Burkholderiales bacterium]|nr:glycosyltransferase family 4 protein [Phycisphaerae bacterium]
MSSIATMTQGPSASEHAAHVPATAAPHLVHLPTPGDHYSAATGSAVMTVIYEFSRCHAAAGGETSVLVSRGTRHDYSVGQCIEFVGRGLPDKKRKLVDSAAGMIGLTRPFERHFYKPAIESMNRSFDGIFLLHNAASAVIPFARRFPNARIFLWPHNDLFGTYSRHEVRRTIDAATGVICVSRFIANGISRRLGGVMTSKLRVVNNGVDTDRFRPNTDRAEQQNDVPIVLFVGRVTPQKAPDLIIRAAAKILSRTRKFKVRIVGNAGFSASDPLTPYERELRALAAPLGDAVEFQSFVDRNKLLSEFDAASIYCVPSNWDDPCPLTVGEGMACGLPSIVARRGGIPEVAADAALYFTPPDIDELSAQLERLINSTAERADWAAKARARATQITWTNQYRELRTQLAAG